jgi:hypothetical protein
MTLITTRCEREYRARHHLDGSLISTEATMVKTVITEIFSREELVGALRDELSRRANGDMSICRLAAERGVFCKGFNRYTDEELRERYGWILRRNPQVSREQLEELADHWQMARQDVDQLPTCCDVQQVERDACGGWADFSAEDLSRFFLELTGRRVVVS